MPPAAAIRRSRTSHMSKSASKPSSRPYTLPLRTNSEESDDTWSEDAQSLSSWQDLNISDLDEDIDWEFKTGDRVWVRTQEQNWRKGKVVKGQPRSQPLTRNKHIYADYYFVQFGSNGKMNTRKYFAPKNGEMKPDTLEIRGLLQVGGWISDDADMSSGPE